MKAGPVAGAIWWGRARREEIRHRRRCAEIMDLLDLGPYRHLPVGMLPFGIQKRIEVGRALAMDPKLLLLDEPVAGMNLEETEDMAAHIMEIREELPLAMILVEHQMDLVMDLVDRLLVLAFGKVVATGTPEEIRSDERVLEAYVGVES
jgi:branched-chain amino acid transport system ATP-binding protein